MNKNACPPNVIQANAGKINIAICIFNHYKNNSYSQDCHCEFQELPGVANDRDLMTKMLKKDLAKSFVKETETQRKKEKRK